jgi:hypothetical protein
MCRSAGAGGACVDVGAVIWISSLIKVQEIRVG